MNFNTSAWSRWVGTSLRTVDADARVPVPFYLPHPSVSGFVEPALAEPAGQVADYVLALSDGTRVHVHDRGPGGLVAHRETDPGHGPISAAWHFFAETKIGRLGLGLYALKLLLGGSPKKSRRRVA